MPLHQLELIARTRALCQQDSHLVAGLMYGSFVTGEGDQFSDIEFWLFFADAHLPQLSVEEWIGQIEPTHLIVTNEVGTQVAFFRSLVRGEFHCVPASTMGQVRTWGGISVPAEQMIVVDRTGDLLTHLRSLEGHTPVPPPERIGEVCGRYLNWIVGGVNVLERGELARAHAWLGQVATYLLWMVRLVERATAHWLTPSKGLEEDVSGAARDRYVRCTATAERSSLRAAYTAAWQWGRELMTALDQHYSINLPQELLSALDERLRWLA